jgi:YtxH-like protein
MSLNDMSQKLGSRLPAADDLLQWVGLQQQRTAAETTLSMLGTFALGTLLGGALALLFAPKAGPELRHDIGGRLSEASERVKQTLTPTPANGKAHPAA